MAEKPIRVLLWSPGGSGEHYHGPGSFSYRLYSKAEPRRFLISLAHGYADQRQYPLFHQQHLVQPLAGGRLAAWRFLGKARRWLADHAGEFDVLHGMAGFETTVSPAYHAQRMGLPAAVFIANHRTDLSDKPGFLKSLLALPRRRRERVKRLSAVIAMSQAIYDELIGYGIPPDKIVRIPMGVDTDAFHPPVGDSQRRAFRRQLGWRDLPTLIFAGGITPRKRPHLLIEALGLLRRKRMECQVAIIGPDHDQAYTAQMKQRAAELQVESQVIWFGFTNDIAPLYRAADWFALPSENEGMPAALVEAMASGLPSVVTAISGMTDLVADGVHGIVIEPTAEQMAGALAEYFKNPGLAEKHGAAARHKVLERFSTAVVLEAYERLFHRMMAEKKES